MQNSLIIIMMATIFWALTIHQTLHNYFMKSLFPTPQCRYYSSFTHKKWEWRNSRSYLWLGLRPLGSNSGLSGSENQAPGHYMTLLISLYVLPFPFPFFENKREKRNKHFYTQGLGLIFADTPSCVIMWSLLCPKAGPVFIFSVSFSYSYSKCIWSKKKRDGTQFDLFSDSHQVKTCPYSKSSDVLWLLIF